MGKNRRHCRSSERRKINTVQRLTGGRDAIVDPTSGVTRDRHYGSLTGMALNFR